MTMRRFLYKSILLLAAAAVGGFSIANAQETVPEAPVKPVVYVIPFQGEVEAGLYRVLQRGFLEAEEHFATYILLEMDTPGGRVDAALEIIDLILESKIPVAILVTGNATSAGAIVSLAANQVFMKQTTTIGTAAPVMLGGGDQGEAMEAKILSYVLAQVRKICEKRGYSKFKTKLAQAMVDKDIEIKDPDIPGEFITEKGKLLTFTATEAKRYGFITELVRDREEALQYLQIKDSQQILFHDYFLERTARFFASTTVSSLLLTIAFIALFIEFQQPGIGLPGAVALLAFLIFFWGHSIAGLAGWEGPILMMIGILLLTAELLLIPGFGFTGIAGILCIIASVVVTLLQRAPTSPHFYETFTWTDLYSALIVTLVSMLCGLAGALAIPILFPFMVRSPVGSWLVLHEREDRSRGYHAAAERQEEFMGKRGVAKTTLRPAGIAEIDGKRVDVVSQGGFVPPNSAVEVVKVEGRRVVVKSV
ncbi:MAG: NfeD family protein [Candidatus Omnitrophota bacterium]